MEKKNYQAQIEDYLDEKLSVSDRKAFEAELSWNDELQKALFIHAMQESGAPSPEEQKIRNLVSDLRNRIGPAPEPRISWWDHLRFAFLGWPAWIKYLGALVVFGFFGLMLWANLTLKSKDTLIQEYYEEAYCPGVAGDDDGISSMRLADFYCKPSSDGIDSLQAIAAACTGFCVAQYYMTHWQLKNQQYAQAESGFSACLDNRGALLQQIEVVDIAAIQLNQILSQLGSGERRKAIVDRLGALLKDGEQVSTIEAKAQSLLQDLNHPLRFLTFD